MGSLWPTKNYATKKTTYSRRRTPLGLSISSKHSNRAFKAATENSSSLSSSSELQKKKRTRDEQETNNDEDKWPSGSKWKETHLGALHILVGAVEQKYVIPEKFLPSEEGKNKV